LFELNLLWTPAGDLCPELQQNRKQTSNPKPRCGTLYWARARRWEINDWVPARPISSRRRRVAGLGQKGSWRGCPALKYGRHCSRQHGSKVPATDPAKNSSSKSIAITT